MHTLAVALLVVVAAVSTDAGTYKVKAPKEWWENTILYEVWVESFKDSDGNGKGDLPGVTSKLDHFVDMGVQSIWLPPFFTSPMFDTGYDVADFRGVDSRYGTIDDFDKLVTQAHELDLKVVIDFVPNHVSDEHEWYVKAKQGIAPYVDYFIWNNGTLLENGTRVPPNNWVSVFNEGSMWLWVPERNAYVFHQFSTRQIDLNFRTCVCSVAVSQAFGQEYTIIVRVPGLTKAPRWFYSIIDLIQDVFEFGGHRVYFGTGSARS